MGPSAPLEGDLYFGCDNMRSVLYMRRVTLWYSYGTRIVGV